MDAFDAVPQDQRLEAIEAKLDAIIRHFGIAYPQPDGQPAGLAVRDARAMPEVVDLVGRGKLILAIKTYRERTGVGLREAKNAIDALASELGGRRP